MSWGRGARSAQRAFLEGKLHACRWFYRFQLPQANLHLAGLARLDDTTLLIRDEQF